MRQHTRGGCALASQASAMAAPWPRSALPQRRIRTPPMRGTRIYLLYWYKRTDNDTEDAGLARRRARSHRSRPSQAPSSSCSELHKLRCQRRVSRSSHAWRR